MPSTENPVTIREVAERAGVSIATVSNVLTGRRSVGAELARRVEAAMAALGYRRNRAAAQLRSGRAQVVGVLVPSLLDTFFTALVSHLEALAAEAGFQVLVVSSRDAPANESGRIEALLGWRPAGLVVAPAGNDLPALLRREFGRVPMVLVDRIGSDGLPVDTVTVDNPAAGHEAAAHLLAQGHRRLAVLASVAAFRPIRDRIRGVEAACAEAGAPPPQVVEVGVEHDAGAAALDAWLARAPQPSALIATTNVNTLAALSALARRGLDIPEHISLIGFDDYPWMTARKVPLSAVRQPIAAIAGHAWAQLRRRIDGEDGPPVHAVLRAGLMRRGSVARLGAELGRRPESGPASAPEAGPEAMLAAVPAESPQPRRVRA